MDPCGSGSVQGTQAVAKQPGLLPDATREFRATRVGQRADRVLACSFGPPADQSRAAGTGNSATVDLPLAMGKADVNLNDIDSPQDDRLSGVQGDPSSFSLIHNQWARFSWGP